MAVYNSATEKESRICCSCMGLLSDVTLPHLTCTPTYSYLCLWISALNANPSRQLVVKLDTVTLRYLRRKIELVRKTAKFLGLNMQVQCAVQLKKNHKHIPNSLRLNPEQQCIFCRSLLLCFSFNGDILNLKTKFNISYKIK